MTQPAIPMATQPAIPMATPTAMLVPGPSPDSGDGMSELLLPPGFSPSPLSVEVVSVAVVVAPPGASVDPGEGLGLGAPSRPATLARWILPVLGTVQYMFP